MPLESTLLSEVMNWWEDGIFFPEAASWKGVGAVDVPGAEEVVLVATAWVAMVAPTQSMIALVMAMSSSL